MKKTFLIFLCIVMVLSVSACNLFVSDTGKKAFEEGKLSLAVGNYEEALGYFELAQSEGYKSKETTDLINCITVYLSALDNYNYGNYEDAYAYIDSIILNDTTKAMARDINSLEQSIQNGINMRNLIEDQISSAERLFALGDYTGAETIIYRLENDGVSSIEQRDKLELLKQQLETAKGKIKSASQTVVIQEVKSVSVDNINNAKNAVDNFTHAYESFVKSGKSTSSDYDSYMSPYSPSWSPAYKGQWNYFNKNQITDYEATMTYDSVTQNGIDFYVIGNENVTEIRNGKTEKSMTKWKYTVRKEGDIYKVIDYKKVK